MKVYVDDEIESCLDCPCHNGEHGHCQITGKCVCDYVPKSCPLQSLSDYTKQVRKEVIEEIKENLLKLEPYCIEQPNLYDFNCQEIIDILDQIEQGEQHG